MRLLTAAVTRHNFALLALVIVPALLGGLYIWSIGAPAVQPRTSAVINRNSLLPHRFVGVCENCHRVLEVGPVEMSRDNMHLFKLAPMEQRLLVAGQRVDAPTVTQRMRVPAIFRDDLLPHSYVGVCSNCHEVLNVRPTSDFMRR